VIAIINHPFFLSAERFSFRWESSHRTEPEGVSSLPWVQQRRKGKYAKTAPDKKRNLLPCRGSLSQNVHQNETEPCALAYFIALWRYYTRFSDILQEEIVKTFKISFFFPFYAKFPIFSAR
jgi:hypothetical protein